MKLLKKLTAIIIILIMWITLNSPIISYAAENTTGGSTADEQTEDVTTNYEIKEEETWDVSKNGDGSVKATWSLENKKITISTNGSGNGEMKNWTSSSKEDWHNTQYTNIVEKIEIESGVTNIGKNAFRECIKLTNIIIPDSVTSIGVSAFYRCGSLENITIPNSVTSIGEDAFSGCSILTSITIPNSVTSIDNYTFSGCSSLTNIEIPNSVTSIGSSALLNCSSLTSITIPSSVTSIKSSAFSGCSSLRNINVEENNQYYISIDGVLYNKKKNKLIRYPAGKKEVAFSIPGSVTSIERYAYGGCSSLTSITIPNSVTSIDNYTFSECSSLKNITIPSSVTSIGIYAFDECSSLTSITIPSSVTSVGDGAFRGCSSLTSITIPNSVTSIGSYAFDGCSSLKNITIPNSVTSIKGYIFDGCSSLTSITIPNSVTSIGSYAFDGCSSLNNITIPSSVTSIGNGAFRECKGPIKCNTNSKTHEYCENNAILYILLDNENSDFPIEYKINNERTWDISKNGDGSIIANWIFENKQITISGSGEMRDYENNSEEIWYNSKYKKLVEKIIIEEGITSIGKNTFYGCDCLTSITIPSSVTSIGSYAFCRCSSLTNIEIPNAVTSIGGNAFEGCISLTSINIPDGLKSIGYDAFYRCGSLTSIEIPNSVTRIGNYAFSGCSSLTNIVIPNSVTGLEYGTFSGCSSLTSITIPNSVKSIGNYAFSGCSSLTNITIPSSVTSIGDYEFSRCSSLTDITIPNSVTRIGISAFYGCSSLNNINVENSNKNYSCMDGVLFNKDKTKIIYYFSSKENTSYTIPSSVTSIERYAYEGCSSLESITIPSSVTSIGESAFRGCSGLTNITIPSSVTSIGIYAFSGCSSLTNIVIPNSVTGLGNGTFSECSSLEKIIIPSSVTSIGSDTFYKCNAILICKKNSEAHRFAEEKKVVYILDNKLPTVTYNPNGNDTCVKHIKTKVEVEDDCALNEDSIRYLWSQKEEVTVEEITEKLTNGEEISSPENVEGKIYLYIYAKDVVGNETMIKSNAFNVDDISPQLVIKRNSEELTNQNVTVTITANEAVQGITGWTLSTDKKTLTKEYSTNKTETVKIKDLVGNEKKEEVKVSNIDKTSPTITGVENGKSYKDSVTALVSDENPGTLLLTKNGVMVEGYTNGKEIIEEGNYQLTATDKAGNTVIVNFAIEFVRGELNGNNEIDIGDVLLLLRHIAQSKSEETLEKHPEWKLSEKRVIIGDINKNGSIDIGDVLKLRRYIAAKNNKDISTKHPDWLNIN